MSTLPFPRKAIILAAGYGSRMRPLSDTVPKPVMPLWGKPLIEHTIELLQGWGVKEILINLHHEPGPIIRSASPYGRRGVQVNFTFEPDLLGTGGALRRAEWFLDRSPFWVINGDIAADVSPRPFIAAYRRYWPLAALWLHPSMGPRTVEMTDGRIVTFRSSRPGTDGTSTFCGLHLLSRRVLDYLPPAGFSTIVAAYERASSQGERILGVCVPSAFWADLGTPENYLDAHRRVREQFTAGRAGSRLYSRSAEKRSRLLTRAGAVVSGFAAVAENVSAARGAFLRNAVLWDGVRLGSRARVEDAVVGAGAEIQGVVSRAAVRCDRIRASDVGVALGRVGWPASETAAMPLEPRGSARTFTRLQRGRESVILIRYSLDRAENALYASHARFLHGIGFPVPRVIADLPAEQLTVIEDVGTVSLADWMEHAPPCGVELMFRRILGAVAILHERGTRKARRVGLNLAKPFSPALFRWEHDLFACHFLKRRIHLPSDGIRLVMRDLHEVARRLLPLPPVLIHRDLQSSNILLKDGRPFFIDFQGMRYGPAAYDLASLLCDPYVSPAPDLQERLLAHYLGRWISPWPPELFWYAAVQRLTHAIGAYGRLSEMPGTARFARYFQPALRMLQRAIAHIRGLPRLRAAVREALESA